MRLGDFLSDLGSDRPGEEGQAPPLTSGSCAYTPHPCSRSGDLFSPPSHWWHTTLVRPAEGSTTLSRIRHRILGPLL